MTFDPEWNALADAWRDEPETTETVDLSRMRRRLKRRALMARLKSALDIVLCLAVGAIAISAIARGAASGVIMGLGGLAFVLFGTTVALWVARAPWETRAQTVDLALRSEIVQTRSAIRRARSGYYLAVGAFAFIALSSATLCADLDVVDEDAWFAIGVSLSTVLASLAWALWTDRRQSRKLARLETMLAQLSPSTEEDD